MATVRRGNDGEITHIEVCGRMYKKKDAHKVMYDNISGKDLAAYLEKRINYKWKKPNLRESEFLLMLSELLSERESVHRMKARILRRIGKISDPE